MKFKLTKASNIYYEKEIEIYTFANILDLLRSVRSIIIHYYGDNDENNEIIIYDDYVE